MEFQDLELGIHKQRVRTFVLDAGELGVVAVGIAAAGVAFSSLVSAPGFSHFAGVVVATTPAATTLQIRVNPRISSTFPAEEFTVATIAAGALATPQRYPFYWGAARGLLLGATGTGSTFCFSRVFRLVVRNTGAQPANDVTLERLEMI